jgi:hypothetical protein
MNSADVPKIETSSAPATGSSGWTRELQVQQDSQKYQRDQAAQQKAYETWYENLQSGKLSWQEKLQLAQTYCTKYGDTKYFHNQGESKAVQDWLKEQNNKPSVSLDLRAFKASGKVPTPEEVGCAVAKGLGFSDGEAALFASVNGFKSMGAAFYKATGQEGDYFLRMARQDPNGQVTLGDWDANAIASNKQWLADYREKLLQNPILAANWEKERTTAQAIETHIAVPTLGFASGLVGGVGDIVRGIGLPLHLISEHTFMDSAADSLGRTSQSLDLTDLYTNEEKSDGGLALLNIYTRGMGGVAPMMVPGLVASRFVGTAGEASESLSILSSTTEAAASTTEAAAATTPIHQVIGEVVGGASAGGQVYDSALSAQARKIAIGEMQAQNPTQSQVEARVQEIKEGKNIDPAIRNEIELRSLGSAAVAIPLGAAYGRWVSEAVGPNLTPASSTIATMRDEATTNSVLNLAQMFTNEESQVLLGAKSQGAANQSINDQLLTGTLSAMMVGSTLGGVSHRTTEVEPEESPSPSKGRVETEDRDKSIILDPLLAVAQEKNAGREVDLPAEPEAKSHVLSAVPEFINKLRPLLSSWSSDQNFIERYDSMVATDQRLDMMRRRIIDKLEPQYDLSAQSMFDKSFDNPKLQEKIREALGPMQRGYDNYLRDSKANLLLHEQIGTVVEPRRSELESNLNAINEAHGLPPIKLYAAADSKFGNRAYAIYHDGMIFVRDSTLLGNDSLATVTSAVTHENTHHEEDYLVVRSIADQLNIGNAPTPDQAKQLKERYAATGIGELKDDRLNMAMQTRAGIRLTPEETARAGELARSLGQVRANNSGLKSIENNLRRITTEEKLAQMSPTFYLSGPLRSLSDSSRNTLFGDRPVPQEVQDLSAQFRANDGKFDVEQAKEILMKFIFEPRRKELEAEKERLTQQYRDFRHEKEAYAVSRAVENALPPADHDAHKQERNRRVFENMLNEINERDKKEQDDDKDKKEKP